MRVVIASFGTYHRMKVIVDEPIGEIFTILHPENWLNDENGVKKYAHRYYDMEGMYFRFDQFKNFTIHE